MMKIGDTIILEPMYSEKNEKYKCKLVEKKGNKLYIDYPLNLNTNRTTFLLDGTQLNGTFITKEGHSYIFDCEVAGKVKLNIPMIILSYLGDEYIFKIQRRQYVRVETAVDVAIHPENGEFTPFTAATLDISAGGAGIIVQKQNLLHQGMTLMLWFVLPMQNGEYHYLQLKSKVVRIIPLNELKEKISVQFIDITVKDRQKLLRFCFDKELEFKKRGLEI